MCVENIRDTERERDADKCTWQDETVEMLSERTAHTQTQTQLNENINESSQHLREEQSREMEWLCHLRNSNVSARVLYV